MKHIVILGGSYGGVGTAHRILKQAAKTGPFKITLVSPNTHLYWNMASSRGLLGKIADEDLFQPIAAGFAHYPAGQFEFILASAEGLDVEAKKVQISGSRTLDYDYLILATGSRTKEYTPFKGLGTTEATKEGLHKFQNQIKKAETIVIAGAGVTGMEVSGEIGSEYGRQKKIIVIASGKTVVDQTPEFVSTYATQALHNLNVEVRVQTKIRGLVQLPNGKQELTLEGGEKLLTDVYIPTFGLVPNSEYVPAKLLNASGFVCVDEHLRVQDAEAVWALGDVCDTEGTQYVSCERQANYLGKHFISILNNEPTPAYKAAKSRTAGFQIGQKAGVGHIGTSRVPSLMIMTARKTLFVENLRPTVDGSLFGSLKQRTLATFYDYVATHF